MPSTVLIVEDDPTTTDFVERYLRRDGHRVLTAADGEEGLRLARERKPDLVVLDVMLPKLDGISVCRTLRDESDVAVIMLTARVDEEDRLTGLEVGADDYVTKPFSPRELAARVRAVLRRASRSADESGPATITHDGLTVDLTRHVAELDGRRITLTPTELRILRLLMAEPGRVFSREQIIGRVFGDDFEGFDRTVDTHVSNLRRKLQGNADKPPYIHTVYGAGYRFGDA
jgi:two-component system OmpR family response regulator